MLQRLWLAAEQPCSKRPRAVIALWLPHDERRYGPLAPRVREDLLRVSPAAIDCLMRPLRARRRKGVCETRPGQALRSQIPIRSGTWDVKMPGYFEADTVAHCGGSLAGDFVWSLTFKDIWSGWTEHRAIWNKGSQGVIERVRDLEARLVFPLRGFACDNGSEFLNHHLKRYFAERLRPVEFTHGRPYHAKDNAPVEQKHWTHVRQRGVLCRGGSGL